MRIAHLEAGRHLYGGAAQVRTLVGGLTARGVDNLLLCATGSELAGAAPAASVRELPMRGDLDVLLPLRLVRELARFRPDVVHVHSRRGAEIHGGLAAVLAGVPAVLTRRVDSAEPAWFGRCKYRPYAAVIALSCAIETQLTAAGVDPARVVRIPSAVDTLRFRPDAAARARLLAAFALPSDALVVGVVAQLIERKGHTALLASLAELVREQPKVRLLLFGRGPLEAALRAQIAARALAGHVTLAGFRADLPELLPGLDVLAHAAVREGLGLALLEAASAGVPVVAYTAGGVPDVVVDGVTGLLVPVGDAAGLCAALARLLARRVERARLGAAARAHAERHFGIDGLVDAHLSLYGRVLGERAAPAAPTVAR
jgi:glycosyltransferase involved in cell wall biosynthesis